MIPIVRATFTLMRAPFLRRVRVEARGCVAGPVSYAPVCPICDALAITWHRCASAPVQLMEQKRKEAEERKKKEDVERERRRKQGGRRRSSARRPSAAAGYETQPLRLPAWRCIHVTQRHESLRLRVLRPLRVSGHHRPTCALHPCRAGYDNAAGLEPCPVRAMR